MSGQKRFLDPAATITTVSRAIWQRGVDAVVIPDGIAQQWLAPCEPALANAIRSLARGRLLLSKVARWDPDKRWIMALQATAGRKARGTVHC